MVMEFEWDEVKRRANLAKHKLDFARAVTMWASPVIGTVGQRIVDGEARHLALGIIGDDDLVIAVVYTMRGGTCRIISARRGRRDERAYYKGKFGRGR